MHNTVACESDAIRYYCARKTGAQARVKASPAVRCANGSRHAEDAASVAAAISAVVAEEVPRTTAELVSASSKGQDHATARGRALVSQLVAAALDETADVWRIRRRAAVRVSETDPELLADLFNKIDIDGSGELERGEIAQMSAELGRPLSDKELDAAMRSMDADGSGSIWIPHR